MSARRCYVIDTSSLIELREKNPMDIYESVWGKLETLIDQGFLISPEEVKREVVYVDDDLAKWVSKNSGMFVPLNGAQMKKMFEIVGEFPGLAQLDKDRPEADPFVIALALIKDPSPTLETIGAERVVVTEERLRGNRTCIPLVCQRHNVKCMSIFDMFRAEGWKF